MIVYLYSVEFKLKLNLRVTHLKLFLNVITHWIYISLLSLYYPLSPLIKLSIFCDFCFPSSCTSYLSVVVFFQGETWSVSTVARKGKQ